MWARRSPLFAREVEGIWTTEDPRYEGRFLELSQAFVIIETGPHDMPSVQWIDKVEIQPGADGNEFTVYSTDVSQRTQHRMALLYSPANGGELRFKNQKQVWRRDQESK